MSGGCAIRQIRHSALKPIEGERLFEADLSLRDRLGVVLQAAALLSHLSAAGWRLQSDWGELKVDSEGLLREARVEPGRPSSAIQGALRTLLLRVFRGDEEVVGRGSTRRIAARLARRWGCCAWSASADRLVEHILSSAPFLWQPTCARARGALVAELTGEAGSRLRVAGRGGFEIRLLGRADTLDAAVELLESPQSLELWSGLPRQPSAALGGLQVGRGAATLVLQAVPPRSAREKLAAARLLHGHGALASADRLLRGLRSCAAQILRVGCCVRLRRVKTARGLIERLLDRRLSPTQRLDLMEMTVAGDGDFNPTLVPWEWVERTLAAGRRARSPRTELIAAEIAWRLRDRPLCRRRLEAAGDCRADPCLAWRWYRLSSLEALAQDDPAAAREAAETALGRSRRRLFPAQAAALWRLLAQARLAGSRLADAERAALHALRLADQSHDDCGLRQALVRWLEIRLRRGRADAMDPLLDRGVGGTANRASEQHREIAALRARLALLLGQPAAALDGMRRALESGSAGEAGASASTLRALSARALGWLGRRREARELLRNLPARARRQLEPEEWPALWALAGDRPRARQVIDGETGLDRLWSQVLSDVQPAVSDWQALHGVEAYRAARMVFDLHLLGVNTVPDSWIERASRELRSLGAESFAERLDPRQSGAWRALERYLHPEAPDDRDLAGLFADAGYFDTRLSWRDEVREQVLVAGSGGDRKLSVPAWGGRLVLRARALDPSLRALFALAARDFRPCSRHPPLSPSMPGMLGESESLRQVVERLERLASSDIPVLIQGETGTGKELAARQVHALSPRASRPFVALNCAALSESLLLSELFGHVRGAFTGADRDRAGIFETARGGTVLLDEIGDLPGGAQAKLLRVLQEGEVRRVGESLPRRVDLRIVAATHRDLIAMVIEGQFRQDLFYRLKVGSVTLPPLRLRGRDVVVLAEQFLARTGHRMTARASQHLLRHSWPGNVRELHNVLQVALTLAEHDVVDVEHLELPQVESSARLGYHQQVEEFRRRLVREALVASQGNRSQAARRLDLSRQALSYLVRRLAIRVSS